MCTIGAVAAKDRTGSMQVFMLKTVDCWAGCQFHHSTEASDGGVRRIAFSVEPQLGVNSGLNEHGLGLVISYSDFRFRDPTLYSSEVSIEKDYISSEREPRTQMNELVLSHCRNVPEAIEFITRFVPQHPDMMGGNHLLADTSGNVAIVEQCSGKAAVIDYSQVGYAGRGNNSSVLIREKQAQLSIIHDCISRQEQMELFLEKQLQTLKNGDETGFIESAKALLGSHGGRPDQTGSICVHNLEVRGTRAPAIGQFGTRSFSTATALLFDLRRHQMLFTLGNPCQAEWRSLQLM